MIRSIRNRIALWHVLMFVAMSLVSFFLLYQLLNRFLNNQIDDLLRESVKRNEWYGNREKSYTITGHIEYYMQIEGVEKVFYLVFDRKGDIYSAPKFETWKKLDYDKAFVQNLSQCTSDQFEEIHCIAPGLFIQEIEDCPGTTHIIYQTENIDGQDFRLCWARLRDGKVYLCGHSLQQKEMFLQDLLKTFWAVFGVTIVLGGIAGLFLANKSVSGVKKVTKIAGEIELGNFETRLDASGDGIEIEDLAERFNAMLDKIQLLLTSLSNISDDVAHDLRTPITRIRGTAEMALTAAAPAKELYESSFCSIIEECDRLVGMIKTMLEITQTDSGVFELELESTDLWKLLETGYNVFRSMAEDKMIQFNLELKGEPVTAIINPNRIQRAISNLLDNAIKFTPENGRIDLIAEGTNEFVHIHVKDNGMGIPPNEQEKVFERFYRSDPSRTIEGNGLGLCLAKAIVHAHKGELTLESALNKGSCFSIQLPISFQH